MKRKQLLVAGAAATIGLLGVGGASLASAATVSSSDGTSSLVDKLASKFNLKKDDVQKVFDENKTAREAERQKEFSDNLQKKVDSGDITADQKTKIEAKVKELKATRDKQRTDLEAWAKSNNIDLKYLRGGHLRGGDDRLQSAVDDGSLTAAQKTLIENKQKDLDNQRGSERDELKKWAEDNEIDIEDIMPLGAGHGLGHGGFGRH